VPTRHQLLITEPIAGVGPEFPIARVIDANVYVRHERGGLMLGGYEPDPLQPDVLPDDVAELPLDIEGRGGRSASPSIAAGCRRSRWTTATSWGRCPAWPVAGRGRRRATSPRPTRRGEAIAEWIVDGAPALDLSEISPGALRRARPRRGRPARALPASLRDPLPRGGRDADRRVNHPSTVYRFERIS